MNCKLLKTLNVSVGHCKGHSVLVPQNEVGRLLSEQVVFEIVG